MEAVKGLLIFPLAVKRTIAVSCNEPESEGCYLVQAARGVTLAAFVSLSCSSKAPEFDKDARWLSIGAPGSSVGLMVNLRIQSRHLVNN